MKTLVHELILAAAAHSPDAAALLYRKQTLSYAALAEALLKTAGGLRALDLHPDERVAVHLPKSVETALGLFGACAAGGVLVPVNPMLKPEQVGHILRDCNVRVLITAPARADLLREQLTHCTDLRHLVCVGGDVPDALPAHVQGLTWEAMVARAVAAPAARRIDADMAAILYTSGSTGRPKGVVLSHRNMVAGAESVATYLHNRPEDRLLAVLPLSFDYGLSQLTTAFHVGAGVVLMDYLLPRDVIKAVARYQCTGLAGVPPLWNQLAALQWPAEAADSLRYITNSGGAMPLETTAALRASLPQTQVYLMYGLTEAFRSTYLPPDQIDVRNGSMGQAIPNAEVMVVREDGTPCEVNEPGELVHRGALVAMGYWNDPARTAERFKPAPGQSAGLPNPEMAVWSGDLVKRDADGYLWFVGRNDEMIKSSGFRVSPTEVEEAVFAMGGIHQAAAFGVPHPMNGQAIVLLLITRDAQLSPDAVVAYLKQQLPSFMVPAHVELCDELPSNANGKIDRKRLSGEFAGFFGGG